MTISTTFEHKVVGSSPNLLESAYAMTQRLHPDDWPRPDDIGHHRSGDSSLAP